MPESVKENLMNIAMRTNKDAAAAVLKLKGSLTGENIEDTLRELAGIICKSDLIIIDCSDLLDLDEKGLKFLCSAHRHILSRNRNAEIMNLSTGLVLNARRQLAKFVPGLTCQQSGQGHCVWTIK